MATTVLAEIVAKLLLTPSCALAVVPPYGHVGSAPAGLAGYFMTGRSVIAGIVPGEATLIATAWLIDRSMKGSVCLPDRAGRYAVVTFLWLDCRPFGTKIQRRENRGQAMSANTIRLTGPELAAEISELGAELVRLQDREGSDLLWSGDPAIWAGRAPLLFPMVGRAKDDRIRVDGRDYKLSKHGFARTSQFSVVAQRENSCALRLAAGPETLISYPFAFQVDVTFEIAGSVLVNRAVVTNQDKRALPVSFGFHPAFRWPLPYGADRDAHAIVFEQDESNQPIRRVQDGLLTQVRHPTPVSGNRLSLTDNLFVDDALIFLSPASRSVTYGAAGRPALMVCFPGMPHLGIWTKPGAGYVCIEPWQGFASPDDFDGEFAERPGVISVPVGGSATFAIQIALLPEMPN